MSRTSIRTRKRLTGRTSYRIYARSIVLSSGRRAIPSHYLITLAFIVQKSYIDAKYIARFNVFTLHNSRFESGELSTSTFYMQLFLQQFTNHILFFLVARILVFCRICSCANCLRGFTHSFKLLLFKLVIVLS